MPDHSFDLITNYLQYNGWFVQSFGWYENAAAVYLTLEYFPLGDLQRYITKPLPEEEAQQITYQVLEGVRFMHENEYAHRDLKPAVSVHNFVHVLGVKQSDQLRTFLLHHHHHHGGSKLEILALASEQRKAQQLCEQ